MSAYLVVEIKILSQQWRNGKEEVAVCELRSGGMKMLTWRARRGGKKKGENLQQPSSEQPACDQHLHQSFLAFNPFAAAGGQPLQLTL